MSKCDLLLVLLLAGSQGCASAQKLSGDDVAKALDTGTFDLKSDALGSASYGDAKEARLVGMELVDQLKVADSASVEYLQVLATYAVAIEDVNQKRVQVDPGEFAQLLTEDLEVKVSANELYIGNRTLSRVIPATFRVVKGGEEVVGARVTCQPDLFVRIKSLLLLISAFAGKDGTQARLFPGKYTYKVYQGDQLIFQSGGNEVFVGMQLPITISF